MFTSINLKKLNATQTTYEYKVLKISSRGFGRILVYQSGALQEVFILLKINSPRTRT
jgi:hypothetical protein